ncbi:MAG: flagellar hook-basal body complex protein FliE [Acidobacteria bacterium]|nr:flagellar hook-basal body complex protein FliE [Acidobacteriota bacterium]
MGDFGVYNNMSRIMPSPGTNSPGTTGKEMPGNSGAPSFGNLLKDAIQQVNDVEKSSQGELQKFLNNESDLHSVMLSLEKADMSFQVMMQVRNKIVQAYQEIMKTQV